MRGGENMMIQHEPDLAVSVRRCRRVWRENGYDPDVGAWMHHGPSGFKFQLAHAERVGSVIVSQAEHDGDEWIHASIAWADSMPRYKDLTTLHQSVFGPKLIAYQVFAAASDHVNIHEYALHLWGRADGVNVLPDFGRAGTI